MGVFVLEVMMISIKGLLGISRDICSPAFGICRDITECKDPAFAEKLLGDGFFIESEDNEIYSPVDGTIVSVFPTNHAFGFELKDKRQIMLHIGLDTVKLDKGTFKAYVSEGDKVRKGTKIVSFNLQELKDKGVDMPIIVIEIGSESIKKRLIDEHVNRGDIIVEG